MQDTLDETLPDTLHMTGIYLMILLTSLSIVTVSIHYYAVMAGALFLAFFMMQVGKQIYLYQTDAYPGSLALLHSFTALLSVVCAPFATHPFSTSAKLPCMVFVLLAVHLPAKCYRPQALGWRHSQQRVCPRG